MLINKERKNDELKEEKMRENERKGKERRSNIWKGVKMWGKENKRQINKMVWMKDKLKGEKTRNKDRMKIKNG